MRNILLAAAAFGGLMALTSVGATAAAVPGAVAQYAAPQSHVVQADWWWHHRHWHHRRWSHGGWHYW